MAYNEEKNIGHLLKTLLNQKLNFVKEIMVVNDGSTDKTADIVKQFTKNSKIHLINLKKRGGKVRAINEFLKNVKSEVIVLESADTIPRKNAIKNILKEFKDPKTGMAGACIMPLNKENGFANFFGNFIYKLHHEIALKNPKFGELIAFRNVIKKMPITAVDEECLAMLIKKEGYKLKYCPKAIVYNKQPTNIKDIIKQRRRIHVGHMDLKRQKYDVSTFKIRNVLIALIKNFQIKQAHRIILASFLELYTRILAYYDYMIKKQNHYKWEVAESTKNLTN